MTCHRESSCPRSLVSWSTAEGQWRSRGRTRVGARGGLMWVSDANPRFEANPRETWPRRLLGNYNCCSPPPKQTTLLTYISVEVICKYSRASGPGRQRGSSRSEPSQQPCLFELPERSAQARDIALILQTALTAAR